MLWARGLLGNPEKQGLVEGRLVLSLEEKRLVDEDLNVDMDLPWAPVMVAGHAYRCVLRVYICKLSESRALSIPNCGRCVFLASDLVFRFDPCL